MTTGKPGPSPAEKLLAMLDADADLAALERKPLPEVLTDLKGLGIDHAAEVERIREFMRGFVRTGAAGDAERRSPQVREAVADTEHSLAGHRVALVEALAERARVAADRGVAGLGVAVEEAQAVRARAATNCRWERLRAAPVVALHARRFSGVAANRALAPAPPQTLAMPSSASVRAVPGSKSVVCRLERGEQVHVFARSGDWLRVGNDEGAWGWVDMGRVPGWRQQDPPEP